MKLYEWNYDEAHFDEIFLLRLNDFAETIVGKPAANNTKQNTLKMGLFLSMFFFFRSFDSFNGGLFGVFHEESIKR